MGDSCATLQVWGGGRISGRHRGTPGSGRNSRFSRAHHGRQHLPSGNPAICCNKKGGGERMAPMKAAHSLPLPMRPAGFLLPSLAALALASCTAPPSSPPPPPAQAPTSRQPASPTAAPTQSEPPFLALDHAYGAELSIEAKSRLNLSKEYAQQVIGHLQGAKKTTNTKYACDELNKSSKAVQAAVTAVDPVKDEIEKKRGKDAYASILRKSISTQDEIKKIFNMHCKANDAAASLAPPPATPTQSQAPFVSPEEMALSPSRSAIEQRDREANEFRAMKTNIEAWEAAAEAQINAAQQNLRGSSSCYTGPRGGTYTLTRSGKKNYGGC